MEIIDVEYYKCPYCNDEYDTADAALLCAENCYQAGLADKADDDRKEMRLNRLYSDE